MRRAKIVCTIGPASQDEATIEALIRAGMNVARLNFSHGTHDDHRRVYETVRAVAHRLEAPVAILQDLQGPKMRVGTFAGGETTLVEGQTFRLVTEDVVGDSDRVSLGHRGLVDDVRAGEDILLDDGLLRLRVDDVDATGITTTVMVGGVLKDRKGMNLPMTTISMPSLTPKDREDLEFGLELGVDFVALSFVRSGLDIHQLRCYLPDRGRRPHIIAKIEKPQAVRNLHEIVAAADGVMIARGDLGVEMPAERVPTLQKQAIDLANSMGKIAITATQMLESMTSNPRPTRAEASDVANAIFDGSDAVMLSAETASGKYPVETVRFMARIIAEAEASPFMSFERTSVRGSEALKTYSVAITRAAAAAADELNVAAVACFTQSGGTARLLKSQHSRRAIVAFTAEAQTYARMALYRGITPMLTEVRRDTDSLIEMVEDALVTHDIARRGDHVIIVLGVPVGIGTPTNTIKFHAIPYR